MKQNHRTVKHTSRQVRTYCPPCPNAAEPEYFTRKAVELLTAGITSGCVVFAMLSLLLIS